MDRADVTAKSRDLIEPLLGKAKAARLIDQLLNLDQLGDVRVLRPLLRLD